MGLATLQPLAAHFLHASPRLRRYLDGQLLISVQASADCANAPYVAASLDVSRRGVAHVRGGMGKLAEALADAVRRHSGRVLYRQRVTNVARDHGQGYRLTTHKGDDFAADQVVFNLPRTTPRRCWAKALPRSFAAPGSPPTAGARSWST